MRSYHCIFFYLFTIMILNEFILFFKDSMIY